VTIAVAFVWNFVTGLSYISSLFTVTATNASNRPWQTCLCVKTRRVFTKTLMIFTSGRHRFLFACNRPERENKLTIKFQTISPSPLGFKFQYCADYYFMGKLQVTFKYLSPWSRTRFNWRFNGKFCRIASDKSCLGKNKARSVACVQPTFLSVDTKRNL